jgi:cytochrome c oxidase assembly protein Cox11
MRLRAFAVVLAAFAFAVVPLAGAMTDAVSAKGTIHRDSDGGYILEIEVTGDTVQCMRYTAPQSKSKSDLNG